MHELIGKKVTVRTVETSYSGILIEAGVKEIQLQSDTGWIVVPVEKIVDISAEG